MIEVEVGLPGREYPIYIGSQIVEQLGELTRRHMPRCDRLLVVTNPTVGAHYTEPVCETLRAAGFEVQSMEIPDGESFKTIATVESIYDHLIAERFTRQSGIVALGGGVVGDVAGYAAASYMRGIDFIQVPTSLLAMVDSSVGGKTGVNHPQAKNIIGAFWQPKMVFADMAFLRTLAIEELRSGFAEVIKHGVIRDADYFGFLEENLDAIFALDDAAMAHVVEGSCRIKSAVVAEDEREMGLRAILNFGHTIGHAIEALGNYGDLRHGECVTIGMVAAARLAVLEGLIDEALVERIRALIERAQLPVSSPAYRKKQILERMASDKKVRDGNLRFVLPVRLGEVTIRDDVAAEHVHAVLKEMGASD